VSWLVLKLLAKDRRSPSHDFHCDAAVGWLAGLKVPPKQSYATASSYRTVRAQQQKLRSGWVGAVAPVWFPPAQPVALALQPLPCRGEATGLAQPSLAKRGQAGTSVRSFFAQEHESRVLG
jgi:hypothetical protein